MTTTTPPSTNISSMIHEHKEEALRKLAAAKEHLAHLERAINDSEIEELGIGVLWVENVAGQLDSIRYHITSVDALARVRVWK